MPDFRSNLLKLIQSIRENEDVCGYLKPLPESLAAEPLGELYFRLTQLTREVEHLHGMRDQEPAPWLLLCRDSDLLNTDGYADRPTSYDKAYIDLMQAYRNAARMIMSVADSMCSSEPGVISGVLIQNDRDTDADISEVRLTSQSDYSMETDYWRYLSGDLFNGILFGDAGTSATELHHANSIL